MSGRWMVCLLAPVLAALLVLRINEAGRRWKASRTLAVVKTVTIKLNQRGRLTPNLIERNIKLLRQAEQLNPAEVALPIARGGQYLSLKRPKAAILALEKALTIEPRGEVYAYIGRAELDSGRREAADVAFRKAILLDHNQSSRLESYLLPIGPSEPPHGQPEEQPNEAPAGEIFSSSFESGDLTDWSSARSR